MRYSHRNGETTPPTEVGWYWVFGKIETLTDDEPVEMSGIFMRHSRGWYDPDGDMPSSSVSTVTYYGPIPSPKEE